MDIYLLIGIVLILGLFLVLFLKFARSKGFSKTYVSFVKSEWQQIQKELESNPEHCLLRGDKLLDHVLQKKGYRGTLGEKLKVAGPLFSSLNEVWSAHKLRNKVAHEVGYKPNRGEVKSALNSFKKALCDLGISL